MSTIFPSMVPVGASSHWDLSELALITQIMPSVIPLQKRKIFCIEMGNALALIYTAKPETFVWIINHVKVGYHAKLISAWRPPVRPKWNKWGIQLPHYDHMQPLLKKKHAPTKLNTSSSSVLSGEFKLPNFFVYEFFITLSLRLFLSLLTQCCQLFLHC